MEQLIDQNTYFPHDNPYHEKLKSFDNFVLRDEEGEAFRGNWNKNAFKNQGPLVLEIGSGYGHFMMDFCSHYPEINFVGMEYVRSDWTKLAKGFQFELFSRFFRDEDIEKWVKEFIQEYSL